jgi:hypothetical protein
MKTMDLVCAWCDVYCRVESVLVDAATGEVVMNDTVWHIAAGANFVSASWDDRHPYRKKKLSRCHGQRIGPTPTNAPFDLQHTPKIFVQ